MNQKKYEGDFTIYCHAEAAHMLRVITGLTLNAKHKARLEDRIHIRGIVDGEQLSFLGLTLQAFDIGSTKAKQFGYTLRFADGLKLTCLGDEPYNEACRPYAENSEWLLSEAFCLYGEREQFKPYEKHHSTVREACETAERLRAKNLVLYHTEDTHMRNRKVLYTTEGGTYFTGVIYVPDDLEVIPLD
jgi:ribonuclease Z